MSLKHQARAGMVWTFSEQFGIQIVNFIVTIVLARFLLPSDFGIIALFSVVYSIATILVDGGLASSLIRTKDITTKDLSTVFFFNIAGAFLLYIIIYLTAPYISSFYNLPILSGIIRLYCLSLIIKSFSVIQNVCYVKEMNFKKIFLIQLPSIIISGVFGIYLAYHSFGVWALVYSYLLKDVLVTIQYWVYSSWRPKMLFDKDLFKKHFNYGYKLALSALLENTFNNIYPIIIGKIYSPTQLGFYNRADSLKQLPVANLSAALNKVTFPLFAEIKNDNVRLKEVYKKMMKVVIFIIAPVLSIMVITAEPLIRLLLTDKWLPAAPYLKILAISGLLFPIHSYNLNILKVKGLSNLFLKLEVIKKILLTLIIIIIMKKGILVLIWGQVIFSFLAFFINTYYTGKILKYPASQQILDILPSISVAVIGVALTTTLDSFLLSNMKDIFRIIMLSSVYLMIYTGVTYILRFKEIRYIKELIKK